MNIEVIETEGATIVVIPKSQALKTALEAVNPKMLYLAELWNNGASSREIANAAGLPKGGAPDSGTTYISQLRRTFPELFPYRNPKNGTHATRRREELQGKNGAKR